MGAPSGIGRKVCVLKQEGLAVSGDISTEDVFELVEEASVTDVEGGENTFISNMSGRGNRTKGRGKALAICGVGFLLGCKSTSESLSKPYFPI